jgi:apolipoprotein D and lipocalin family protein
MKRFFFFLILGCSTTTSRLNLPELQTVSHVNLNRYVGTWYEIAHFPKYFQKNCNATTATYTLKENGDIEVFNRCRLFSVYGKERSATGVARVEDPVSCSKLKVSFFWPFWGEYWIIDLDSEYTYAVVGDSARDSLWILSRKPVMDPVLYARILDQLKQKGFEVQKLVLTAHGL